MIRRFTERLGLTLRAVRWETDSYPGFHINGPQGLIDSILKIEDCDILIGIFWKRFGTPTNEDGKTGTEHEFYKAYEEWNQNKRPQIMLYFNQKPHYPRTQEELQQHAAVLKFKENLPKEGLFWDYTGLVQFKEFVHNHLTNYIQEKSKMKSLLKNKLLLVLQVKSSFRITKQPDEKRPTEKVSPADTALEYIEALEYIANEDYFNALSCLDRSLEVDPKN
jgi:hypothetical protein